MCVNYVFDADFAAHLINKLKEMYKSDNLPFIRHGVTLPFLAYAYKCLNNDNSAISEDYLSNIINSLEKAKAAIFLYKPCSAINENVITLKNQDEVKLGEQGFYTRFPNATLFYNSEVFKTAPSSKELYKKYNEVLLNKTFSRVYKENKYDWDAISKEEDNAIKTIINSYKSK